MEGLGVSDPASVLSDLTAAAVGICPAVGFVLPALRLG